MPRRAASDEGSAGDLPSVGLWRTLGAAPRGERQRRVEASPQWDGRRFRNPEGARMSTGVKAAWDWLAGGSPHRRPAAPVPIRTRAAADFARPAAGLRVTWLGHGTSLVEIGGRRLLVDPVWSANAAPGPLFGVRRFHPPPLALAALPPLDAVLLTHDHYDHLDAETVTALAARVPRWVCPLGVGARLEGWGVPPEAVTELDWWETAALAPTPEASGVAVTATPARHFSGRFLTDRDATLWCGYALAEASGDARATTGRPGGSPLREGLSSDETAAPEAPHPSPSRAPLPLTPEASGGHRVYVGGDGGYSAAFQEVGARLGPFDVALMEVGAYNQAWADIHLGPEQAVRAALDARARLLLPVHWATFDLALHGWTEPGERVRAAAREAGLPLALPRPGESVTLGGGTSPEAYPTARWWPALPWETAAEAPVVSANVGAPEAFAPPPGWSPPEAGASPAPRCGGTPGRATARG